MDIQVSILYVTSRALAGPIYYEEVTQDIRK